MPPYIYIWLKVQADQATTLYLIQSIGATSVLTINVCNVCKFETHIVLVTREQNVLKIIECILSNSISPHEDLT